MTTLRLELRPYALPLARPVRGRVTRRGWLLRVALDGVHGWGDAACWPGFGAGPRATRGDLRALLEPAATRWLHRAAHAARALDLDALERDLAARVASPAARHALEVALLDLTARARGLTVAALLSTAPGALPRPLPSTRAHALVRDADEARAAVARGVDAVKLKLDARASAPDDARLALDVRAAIGERVALRLDVNGGWSPAELGARLRALAPAAPQWVEQPLAPRTPGEVALLAAARRAGSSIAADEGAPDLSALEALLAADAIDAVVIKPQATGGLLPARRMARRALDAGLEVCVTHALDSAVGRAAATHLALALGCARAIHGLAPALARDVAAGPRVDHGRVRVVGPGLGVEPDPRGGVVVVGEEQEPELELAGVACAPEMAARGDVAPRTTSREAGLLLPLLERPRGEGRGGGSRDPASPAAAGGPGAAGTGTGTGTKDGGGR